jgi:hypothetical protein
VPIATPTSAPRGWTQVPFFEGSDPATQMNGITFGDGLFVAVGVATHATTKAATWLSRDGLTWVERGQANFPEAFNAVTYNGADFYAFASAPTTVWKSADANHWDQVDLPVSGGELGGGTAFEGSSVVDATSAHDTMYAAGFAGLIGGDIVCDNCVGMWRSQNGTDWSQTQPFEDDSFQSFAVIPDMALVIANGTYIGQALRASSDFDTWAPPDIDLAEGSGYLDTAAASNDQIIVAVGYAGEDYDIPISLVWDGSKWSGTSIEEGAGAPAEQVTFADGRFVAVGTLMVGGRLHAVSWSSHNGLDWTRGPDVYDLPRPPLPPEAGDDPFQHRTIGGGDPGFVVAQTLADGLHVWFATAGTF